MEHLVKFFSRLQKIQPSEADMFRLLNFGLKLANHICYVCIEPSAVSGNERCGNHLIPTM